MLRQEIAEKIRKANHIVITSHQSPDGDCLGSILALGLSLKKLGKQVDMIIDDDLPPYLQYLPRIEEITRPKEDQSYDLMIVVDLGDLKRMGKSSLSFHQSNFTICIDHHRTNEHFCKLNYVEVETSSTCEILAEFLMDFDFPMDSEIASCLYTGIITDSNRFLYENAGAKCLRIAAKLLDKGADAKTIYYHEYSCRNPKFLALLGEVIDHSISLQDGKVLLAGVSQEEMKKHGILYSEVEGLVGELRDLKGIEVAVMVKEQEENIQKISFRSKRYFDVSQLAESFGGGGHKKAAGASMETTFDQAKKILQKKLEALDLSEN